MHDSSHDVDIEIASWKHGASKHAHSLCRDPPPPLFRPRRGPSVNPSRAQGTRKRPGDGGRTREEGSRRAPAVQDGAHPRCDVAVIVLASRDTLLGVQGVIHRNGRQVAGFGLGTGRLEWVAMRNMLQDTNRLVATGHGASLVEWDGEKRTALETTELLRRQMDAGLGLGHPEPPPPPTTGQPHPSPWKYAVVMSVASAATGWLLEAVARTFRKKKKDRR